MVSSANVGHTEAPVLSSDCFQASLKLSVVHLTLV